MWITLRSQLHFPGANTHLRASASTKAYFKWGFVAFSWGQFHRKCSRYLSLIWVWRLVDVLQDYWHISQGPKPTYEPGHPPKGINKPPKHISNEVLWYSTESNFAENAQGLSLIWLWKSVIWDYRHLSQGSTPTLDHHHLPQHNLSGLPLFSHHKFPYLFPTFSNFPKW